MNLEQSVSLEGLRLVPKAKPEKLRMTALQMAKHIFKISAAAGHPYRNITPEQWMKKWLVSPVFVLAEVETDRVALIRTPRNINKVLTDLAASASNQEPVVVDLNRNKLAAKNGFVPKVVAVDGAHRAYGEYLRGRDLIKAWVGTKALERIRPEPLLAATEEAEGPRVQGTKLSSAAELYDVQAGGPGSGRHPGYGTSKQQPGNWIRHSTVGNYDIHEGRGPRGGEWMARERVGRNPEVKVFNNQQDAVDHAENSSENWNAAQGMPAVPRQDTGDGGSQPTGRIPTVMRSGAPDGSTFIKNRGVGKAKSNGHAKDCKCAECREMAAGGAGAGAGMGGPGASLGNGSGPTPKISGGGPGSGPRPGQRRADQPLVDAIVREKRGLMHPDVDDEDPGAGGRRTSSTPGEEERTRKAMEWTENQKKDTSWFPGKKLNAKKVKAGRTPEARSSGHLNEPDPSDEDVPPDPSDAGQSVSPSDRLQYEDEPQHNPPGVKGWTDEVRGRNNPMSDAPGSGVGPRLRPDRGASNSELRRTVKAKGCSDCPSMFASAKHVRKIWNDFKAAVAKGYVPTMKSKAPPGCEDAVMGLKKSKVDNPFAVAWWMHNQGRC